MSNTRKACTMNDGFSGSCTCTNAPKSIIDVIRPGDRVTIRDRFNQERSGRAVMRGPSGWVLNMGGRHGTPAIADEQNIVKVTVKGR